MNELQSNNRRIVRLSLILILVLTVQMISAQPALPPRNLDVIDSSNWERVREIAYLGYGVGGRTLWSEDGQTLFFGSSAGIYAYDVAATSAYALLPDDAIDFPPMPRYEDIDRTRPIATSPDGQIIVDLRPRVSDERNATLFVKRASSGEEITRLAADSPLVNQRLSDDIVLPQFADDGRLLYLRMGSLYQWNPDTNTETLLIEQIRSGTSWNYTDIRLNTQGTYAETHSLPYAYHEPNTLTIYDLATQPASATFEQTFPAQDAWHSVAVRPNGLEIATGGNNANVRVWDVTSGGRSFRDDNPPNEFAEQELVDLAYTADGRYLVGCLQNSAAGTAFVRDADNGETLAALSGVQGTGFTFINSIAVHPNENTIAIGGANGTVQIWSVADLIERGHADYEDAPLILQAHDQVRPVVDVNFSPDGALVASASWDGTVTVWNYATKERLHAFVLADMAWSAVFSPDGDTLATSGEDGKVILWDLYGETARLLDVMTPESQYDNPYIMALAFNHDGSLLAGTGENGALTLWETATGARRTIRERAGNPIWHLQFSADGTMLVTASQDTDVQIWGVPPGEP